MNARTATKTVSHSTAALSTARIAAHRRLSTLLGAVLLGLATLACYLLTLAPTVLPGDPGRFQARAYALDIGHATGYPTFIMLGKLFTYLPVGDVAYRVNLSSAVYGALAVSLLYLVTIRLTASVPAALVAAASFGLSRTYWSQAVIAEVYTLHALFICAVMLALAVWRDTRRDRYLLAAAFLCGLSLTNHATSGLLIPSGLLWIAMTDLRRLRDWRLALKGAALFALGLLPYAYLPIRASMNPPMNYTDPSTPERFFYLVTGRQFADRMFAFGPGELPERLGLYWADLRLQGALLLLPLALVGILWSFRHDRPASAFLAALFTGQLAYALEYDISDINAYFIPTYISLAVWSAFGVRAILDFLREVRSSQARRAAMVLLGVVLLMDAGLSWRGNLTAVDQSENLIARRQIERVVALPQGALLYDTRFTPTLDYLDHVERRRQDLGVCQITPENVRERLEQDLRSGRKVFLLYRDFGRPEYAAVLHDQYPTRRVRGLWSVSRAAQQPAAQPRIPPADSPDCREFSET